MSLNNTTMRGTNAKIVFFQDGSKVVLDAKTWTIKPNVTKNADGVNGEVRDRLSKTLNYYEISIQCFQRDTVILEAYLADQANEDAQVAGLDKSGGFRLYPRDGSSRTFVIKDIVWDEFEENQGGRSEAVMVTLNMRASDVVQTQSI